MNAAAPPEGSHGAPGPFPHVAGACRAALPDYDYAYHVIATDHSGNKSAPSGPLRIRTPAHPGSSCRVEYATFDQGPGAFLGAITLDNTGVWHDVYTIRFTLPAGQRITWSNLAFAQATNAAGGTDVVLWYAGWAGGLPSGVTYFQFTATHDGANPPANGFRLNGQACAPR